MERSRLSEWAAIAEIVAALAVIASLVYLAIQVRENTNAVQAATFQELVNASDAYLLTLAQDSSLAGIMLQASRDPSGLGEDEWLRYFYAQRAWWRNMENAFFQRQRGLLGDDEWGVYESVMCSPPDAGREQTWAYHRPAMSPPFVAFIEACSPERDGPQ